MRTRKLKVFSVFFMIFVLLAAYGLALLRTYAFKPQPSGACLTAPVIVMESSVVLPWT